MNWLGTALANPLTGDAAKAATRWTFIVAGLASLALAAFSLMLPRSAPQARAAAGAGRTAWAEAFGLLKHPFILVLWLVTLVDSFVHNAYFNWTGVFLGTRARGRRRRHRLQLDHAGHEHRPGRRRSSRCSCSARR